MSLEENLVYVHPCIVCGNENYSSFYSLKKEGPVCSENCDKHYETNKREEYIAKTFCLSALNF